ncbi:MAG: Ppx/GppA phosphatase family protein [Acidobacteriota bacterium]|nr:Ppx/GppA phosphatase family protein [Acidobacteriota bacterium]
MTNQPFIIAALDLGSNSFHMVIARVEDGRVVILDTLKEMVRLRQGLNRKGILSREAQERALDCLQRFEQRLRGIPRENIRVVGTNTLRGAQNAGPFLQQIQTMLNVRVQVIAGREEARLIYMGVANQLPESDYRNLVVDIGGGSTEFIIGRNREPLVMESRPMGCVSYTNEFFGDGRITRRRFKDALDRVAWLLEPHRRKFKRKNWDVAIGTSGTAKATAGILQQMGGSGGITRDGLEKLAETMIQFKHIKQISLEGLKDERAPVYIGGLAILLGVFRAFKVQEMSISYQSLREGVILDFIGRESDDYRQRTVKHMMDFYQVNKQQAAWVRETALKLLPQIEHLVVHDEIMARQILGWAADLHEIGLAIAHPNYHRHGSYILLNGDMAGFSQVEQNLLSFLVLNHRKSLKRTEEAYENELDWALLLALRLAVIFHRERRFKHIPEVGITWNEWDIQVTLPDQWLEEHPLTRADLEMEMRYWKKLGYTLEIDTALDRPN